MASWIKPVLISTGFVAIGMHLKAIGMHLKVIVPVVAVDFSRAPILLSSFLSWLKPPYLYIIINVIIIVIGVSSRYYRSITNHDGKDHEVSYSGDYKFQTEQNVHRAPPRRSETKDADFSFVAAIPPSISVEEKERPEVVTERLAKAAAMVAEEKICLVAVTKSENLTPVEKPLVSARIGHRKLVKTTIAERNSLKALRVAKPRTHETLENTWKLITEGKSTPSIIVEEKERPEVVTERLAKAAAMVAEEKICLVVVTKSENLTPVEKPLVSARIGHRKLVKTTTAERNSLKALRVAKPRTHETLENTWKLITEGKSTPLTSIYRRPDTFGVGDGERQSGLKKSETVKDRTKYYLSPAVSRSRDDLNRRAEAFIKKCNDERFASMRLDKEVACRGLSY